MTVATGSHKRCMRKFAYIAFYGIKHTVRNDRRMTPAFLSQLGSCKSEEARRLLLGVSRKFADGEAA
jgi:hypothetical protein